MSINVICLNSESHMKTHLLHALAPVTKLYVLFSYVSLGMLCFFGLITPLIIAIPPILCLDYQRIGPDCWYVVLHVSDY